MKKVSNYLNALLLVILLAPVQLFATPFDAVRPMPITPASEAAVKLEVMIARLNEINDMDKSNLGAAERKKLRKEVRSLEDSVKSSEGGVYISVGAAIIIVLLLIILL